MLPDNVVYGVRVGASGGVELCIFMPDSDLEERVSDAGEDQKILVHSGQSIHKQ